MVMKQKYHLISSVISMFLTCVLLIFVCLAWYVTNQEADAGGVSGSIVERTTIIENIQYYKVLSKTEENDTTNLTLGTASSSLDMESYDTLSSTITSVLIEIELVDNAVVSAFEFTTKAAEYNTTLSETGNSLSSIIQFSYLASGTRTGAAFSYAAADLNYHNFVDFTEGTGGITGAELHKNPISLVDSLPQGCTVIYILLDYYAESLEHIYSENIGNEVLDKDIDLEYTSDFTIKIDGEVKSA